MPAEHGHRGLGLPHPPTSLLAPPSVRGGGKETRPHIVGLGAGLRSGPNTGTVISTGPVAPSKVIIVLQTPPLHCISLSPEPVRLKPPAPRAAWNPCCQGSSFLPSLPAHTPRRSASDIHASCPSSLGGGPFCPRPSSQPFSSWKAGSTGLWLRPDRGSCVMGSDQRAWGSCRGHLQGFRVLSSLETGARSGRSIATSIGQLKVHFRLARWRGRSPQRALGTERLLCPAGRS